jgi:hypothetical protein
VSRKMKRRQLVPSMVEQLGEAMVTLELTPCKEPASDRIVGQELRDILAINILNSRKMIHLADTASGKS